MSASARDYAVMQAGWAGLAGLRQQLRSLADQAQRRKVSRPRTMQTTSGMPPWDPKTEKLDHRLSGAETITRPPERGRQAVDDFCLRVAWLAAELGRLRRRRLGSSPYR